MKYFFILFILFLNFSFVLSQNNFFKSQEEDFIQISFGPAQALGKLIENDFSKTSSGFALNGYSMELDWVKMLTNQIGINTHISAIENNMDLKVFDEKYSNATTKIEFYNGGYQFFFLTTGLFFKQEIIKKISFTTRVLSGVLFAYQNELVANIYEQDTIKNNQLFAKNISSITVPLIIGAGIKVKINKKFGIAFNTDYFMADVNFKSRNSFSEFAKDIKQSLKILKFSFGMTYNFSEK